MKYLLLLLLLTALVAISVSGQTRPQQRATPHPIPSPVQSTGKIPDVVPIKEVSAVTTADNGGVSGRTYTNSVLGFEITFPDTWLIPGTDFEDQMKKQGFDLTLKAPDSLPATTKAQMNRALERVTMLVTAYRAMPGSAGNAIARVSVEDLSLEPQIKDGVDYVDAVRSSYAAMQLPDGFRYSETQAEQLKSGQFAFLDTSQGDTRKRVYVTVRGSKAILLAITYTKPEDLQIFRDVLSAGNFHLNK